MTEPPAPLSERTGLPEALALLVREFPRTGWQNHPNFGEMVRFWLDRHAMFRDLSARLGAETRDFLDGRAPADAYPGRLSRMGGLFLNQLHAHHQIEDLHYFPRLATLEPRLERGFAMLERDHEEMDALLHAFAEAANTVLQGAAAGPANADLRTPAAQFQRRMDRLGALLERHLTDEEDLVVPVILKSGYEG